MNDKIISTKSLSSHYLLDCLSKKDRQTITSQSSTISLEKDEVLFNKGNKAEYFYIVMDGKIQLYIIAQDNKEKIVEIIRPPQSFAEAVMFLPQKIYPVNAKSITKSTLIAIPNSDFLKIVKNDNDLSMCLLNRLSIKLHEHINEIQNLTINNATYRVVNYLLTQYAESKTITLDIHKQILASRLSVKPETLSRILHKLSEQEIIEVSGKEIYIKDLDALKSNYLTPH